ncbi:MAG TPA: glycosyltransferase family 8 protein [Sphingobacteriaceae bacterium]
MEEENAITIVAASDNHYIILLGALIKSIEINHRTGEKLHFHIIDDGISSKNRIKLERSIDPAKTTLSWFHSSEIVPSGTKLPVDRSAFPLTTYLRLFAPYIVADDLTKILYLDVDMIAMEDISKLWNTDLGAYLFGAVQDLSETVCSSWGGIPNYRELKIPELTKYFNAGLMLLNPKKWRELNITNRVISALHENICHVNFADQYGLNVVLYNQWMELDPRWNSFSVHNIQSPFLIHFLDIKPIFKSYRSNPAYQRYFFYYLEQTEWKDLRPISGYKHVVRKIYNKLKKRMLRTMSV